MKRDLFGDLDMTNQHDHTMTLSKIEGGVEVSTGGQWEEQDWEIKFDVEVSQWTNVNPCKHCGPKYTKEHQRGTGLPPYTQTYWICPRVVVASNESECNNTGVCLDCILEAAKLLETNEHRETQ